MYGTIAAFLSQAGDHNCPSSTGFSDTTTVSRIACSWSRSKDGADCACSTNKADDTSLNANRVYNQLAKLPRWLKRLNSWV
jgi:hypothetical protein